MARAQTGRTAGHRAAARLGARKLDTRHAPVLLPPELARGFWGHFTGAISGGALYRKATFLLDRLGEDVFSPAVTLRQAPHQQRASGSAHHASAGVATQARPQVDPGRLESWQTGGASGRESVCQCV